MSTGITKSLRDAERAIRKAQKAELDRQGDEALRHIITRTMRGIGINERKFAPYAPSTARRKGRFQPVTLVHKDRMLRDLYVRSVKGKREILFRSRRQEQIGRWHVGGTKRMSSRLWFGLTTRYARTALGQFGSRVSRELPADRRKRIKVVVGV